MTRPILRLRRWYARQQLSESATEFDAAILRATIRGLTQQIEGVMR